MSAQGPDRVSFSELIHKKLQLIADENAALNASARRWAAEWFAGIIEGILDSRASIKRGQRLNYNSF